MDAGVSRTPIRILPFLMIGFLAAGMGWHSAASAPLPQQPTPQPGLDRLAIPVLPENPTQIDLGNQVYYYHCMPCHGDQGQGLTDEWRQVWEEDHRNCWGRGCHGGREKDEGFPLPRSIPSVLELSRFHTADDLFHYLQQTHPPQYPGKLAEQDYWSATAFVLHLAGRLAPGEQVGPAAQAVPAQDNPWALAGVSAVVLILWLALSWQVQQSEKLNDRP